jgi:hypothetical protein
MTQLELANIALGHLGQASIADYNETSPPAEAVRRYWDLVRDALLRERHWNFAILRVALAKRNAHTLAAGVTTNGSTTATCTSTTGVLAGDRIDGNGISSGTKVASVTNGTTLVLDTAATATATGLTLTTFTPPLDEYSTAFALPSDYLLGLEINQRELGTSEASADVEGAFIFCNDETAILRYVAKVADQAKWDSNFCEAFAIRLASRVATSITTAQGLAQSLAQQADMMMVKASGPDARETRPRALMAGGWDSDWMAARQGFNP